MNFPSKVTPYKDSIIAQFPEVLTILEKHPMTPNDLFIIAKKSEHVGIGEFVETLDCLYALKKIELREEMLHYVG